MTNTTVTCVERGHITYHSFLQMLLFKAEYKWENQQSDSS